MVDAKHSAEYAIAYSALRIRFFCVFVQGGLAFIVLLGLTLRSKGFRVLPPLGSLKFCNYPGFELRLAFVNGTAK